jgi:hypothetical protein
MKRKIVDAGSAEAHYAVAADRLQRAQKRLAAGLAALNAEWAKSDKTSYCFAGTLNLVADYVDRAADHLGR